MPNSVIGIRDASARRSSAPCAAATGGPIPTPARPTVTAGRFDAREGARAPEGHRAGRPVPVTAVAEGSSTFLVCTHIMSTDVHSEVSRFLMTKIKVKNLHSRNSELGVFRNWKDIAKKKAT